MNTGKQRGLTLIELMFALGIVGILLNVGLPSFDNFIDKSKISAEISQMRGALQLARKTAITQSKKVTLCPTTDGNQCSKGWSNGYMVFVDNDQDRQYDDSEEILFQHQIESEDISLRWRAFGPRNSLQWHQTGITNHQNGSFEYCYKNRPKLSRGIFVTKAGRIRVSKDSNGDGIHENARGNNIKCKT